MQLQEQIITAINTTLKNPIYQTMQLLNIKSTLKSDNFVKKSTKTSKFSKKLLFHRNFSLRETDIC
jgi:hypothetical protein